MRRTSVDIADAEEHTRDAASSDEDFDEEEEVEAMTSLDNIVVDPGLRCVIYSMRLIDPRSSPSPAAPFVPPVPGRRTRNDTPRTKYVTLRVQRDAHATYGCSEDAYWELYLSRHRLWLIKA